MTQVRFEPWSSDSSPCFWSKPVTFRKSVFSQDSKKHSFTLLSCTWSPNSSSKSFYNCLFLLFNFRTFVSRKQMYVQMFARKCQLSFEDLQSFVPLYMPVVKSLYPLLFNLGMFSNCWDSASAFQSSLIHLNPLQKPISFIHLSAHSIYLPSDLIWSCFNY